MVFGVGLLAQQEEDEESLIFVNSFTPTAPIRAAGVAPITTCPHCSKLVNGSCVVCSPGDLHPSCEFCEEGRIVMPWYRNELVVAIFTTVVVSVASALILQRIQGKKKRSS